MIIRQKNASLLPHNTFGLSEFANELIEYTTLEELQSILKELQESQQKFLHIGSGSNLLFTKPFEGTVLHSQIDSLEVTKEDDQHVFLRVGAGVVFDELVDYCVKRGWGGVENLSNIPGEVGASAVQNIGAYGSEAKDVIDFVETITCETGKIQLFENQACQYGYRQSIFKNELKGQHVITHVTFKLTKEPVFNLEYGNLKSELLKNGTLSLSSIRQTIISIRESKLPDYRIEGNAGSFFMNPIISQAQFSALQSKYPTLPHYEVDLNRVKIPAAWLIDTCGWKGKKIGKAAVHDKQALVIVNKGGATGADVSKLAIQIQESVLRVFGIRLVPEVIYL